MENKDIEEKVLYLFKNTNKKISKIAQENNLSLEEVYSILEKNNNIEKIERNSKIVFSPELDEKIYNLRKLGCSYQNIAKEIGINCIIITERCKKIFEQKGEKITKVKKFQEESINELIYNLRKSGYSYQNIAKEVGISRTIITERCKKIFEQKGENITKVKKFQEGSINELIYNLRVQGSTYERIVTELDKKGIKMNLSTVRIRCKKIFDIKKEIEPDLRKNKIQIDPELIYALREQGLTYLGIEQECKMHGINVSSVTIANKCKEIYASKGKKDINSIQEKKEKIYNLRQQGWTYQKIAEKLGLSTSAVAKSCERMYSLKGENIPKAKRKKYNKKSDESKKIDETIYNLRKQGLTYPEISDKLKENGSTLTKQGVEQRFRRFLKLNEQKLAQAILNLTITRKATIEQIKQIAEYYGVDLEKTMNSLEER